MAGSLLLVIVVVKYQLFVSNHQPVVLAIVCQFSIYDHFLWSLSGTGAIGITFRKTNITCMYVFIFV